MPPGIEDGFDNRYLRNLGADSMAVVRWPRGCLRRNLCNVS
jgi:hypothetical protein